jgi:hypothetical protein
MSQRDTIRGNARRAINFMRGRRGREVERKRGREEQKRMNTRI